MYSGIKDGFINVIETERKKEYYRELMAFVEAERNEYTVFPKTSDIYRAFKFFALEDTKIVIIGQDPYHGERQANGLAFSVYNDVKIPPSLRNIIKELKRDMACHLDRPNDLSDIANQGVLLINAVLTVRKAEAASHRNKGWEKFTDEMIKTVSKECKNVVFMLWGKDAEKKRELIDEEKHLVLISSHPSPLSARRGFNGCSHFSKANEYLKSKGRKEIKWI